MTKNFKKMIEDGLEQHEIRFDFERKSLYTIINDFLNIHPEQKVFYANGFFLKTENETRYYLKEKNLSLFWKRYADRIHCIHERFVNIIIEAIERPSNMKPLKIIYGRNSSLFKLYPVFTDDFHGTVEYAPELLAAAHIDFEKYVIINNHPGKLSIKTSLFPYLDARFEYRNGDGIRECIRIFATLDNLDDEESRECQCFRQYFPVETLVKTNNSFSVFEDAQWIKIGDQYQVYIDNVDPDILEDILTFVKANDTSCFVRTERNTDRDCSFFFFCNQEIYDRLCTKECEQI